MACSFGLAGLLAWLLLTVYPLTLFAFGWRRRDALSKIVFLAFASLFVHASWTWSSTNGRPRS
jgi:hypothetical protein